MINVIFYSLKERRPKHKQRVVFLEPVISFSFVEMNVSMEEAWYEWEERDELGQPTGTILPYTRKDEDKPPKGCVLLLRLGNTPYSLDDKNLHWCTEGEFMRRTRKASRNE